MLAVLARLLVIKGFDRAAELTLVSGHITRTG
jgi:hypothetical protein